MTPRTAAARARGFTLVEVMVALMIMSILAVMAWQGVDGIVRTREASQERLEQTLRLNTVLGQLEHDLQALQDTPVVPAFAYDGATLRFTRRAETGLQVVTWSLRPNADGVGNAWLRWASPPARTNAELQETWLRTQQFQGAEPGQLRTLPGVAQWQVYCFRANDNNWSNCQSSGNVTRVVTQVPVAPTPGASAPGSPASAASAVAATPVTRQDLPTGVRVVLTFDGGGLAGSLTRDIAIGP